MFNTEAAALTAAEEAASQLNREDHCFWEVCQPVYKGLSKKRDVEGWSARTRLPLECGGEVCVSVHQRVVGQIGDEQIITTYSCIINPKHISSTHWSKCGESLTAREAFENECKAYREWLNRSKVETLDLALEKALDKRIITNDEKIGILYALIDTAERETDLDNVYNDSFDESYDWDIVHEAIKQIVKDHLE
jgi:hypothetical protein